MTPENGMRAPLLPSVPFVFLACVQERSGPRQSLGLGVSAQATPERAGQPLSRPPPTAGSSFLSFLASGSGLPWKLSSEISPAVSGLGAVLGGCRNRSQTLGEVRPWPVCSSRAKAGSRGPAGQAACSPRAEEAFLRALGLHWEEPQCPGEAGVLGPGHGSCGRAPPGL